MRRTMVGLVILLVSVAAGASAQTPEEMVVLVSLHQTRATGT